jgi:hypothetical protein
MAKSIDRKRVVHYSSVGMRGLVFACWQRELTAHLESRRVIPASGSFTTDETGRVHVAEGSGYSAERYEYGIPGPQSRTKLTQVTCGECWQTIARMARERGAK